LSSAFNHNQQLLSPEKSGSEGKDLLRKFFSRSGKELGFGGIRLQILFPDRPIKPVVVFNLFSDGQFLWPTGLPAEPTAVIGTPLAMMTIRAGMFFIWVFHSFIL